MELLAAIFLFLKTGERFATQETAGPAVAEFTSHLGAYEPRVMNDPVKAAEFCAAKKPALGIVTPGFYLAYGKALGMEPLLETKRAGIAAERFVVVAHKDSGEDVTGKTVATTLAAESRYVIGVILRDRFGRELRLKPVRDAESAIFDLAEGAKDAADAVLVEEAGWKVFEADAELAGKLRVVFRSEELPRDLVVSFGCADAGKVAAMLKDMTASEAGQKILRSIRVEAFVDVDRQRLSKAGELFLGK
jgi:hypothetical protein